MWAVLWRCCLWSRQICCSVRVWVSACMHRAWILVIDHVWMGHSGVICYPTKLTNVQILASQSSCLKSQCSKFLYLSFSLALSLALSTGATLTTSAQKYMEFRELFNQMCSFWGESCFCSSPENRSCHLDLAGSWYAQREHGGCGCKGSVVQWVCGSEEGIVAQKRQR